MYTIMNQQKYVFEQLNIILTTLQPMGAEIVTCQGSRVLERSTDPKKLVYTINIYLWSEETGKGMSFSEKYSTQIISIASTMNLFG